MSVLQQYIDEIDKMLLDKNSDVSEIKDLLNELKWEVLITTTNIDKDTKTKITSIEKKLQEFVSKPSKTNILATNAQTSSYNSIRLLKNSLDELRTTEKIAQDVTLELQKQSDQIKNMQKNVSSIKQDLEVSNKLVNHIKRVI